MSKRLLWVVLILPLWLFVNLLLGYLPQALFLIAVLAFNAASLYLLIRYTPDKKYIYRLLLLLSSTLCTLIVLEVALRLNCPSPFRLSRQKQAIFDLSPNYTHNILYTTNQYGLRDYRTYSEKKPNNTYRICGVGDSEIYGYGVEMDSIYLKVLERLLRKRFPEKNIEVINFGIPGYNSVQEYYFLKSRVLDWQPNLVLWQYTDNDYTLPNWLPSRSNLWFRYFYVLYTPFCKVFNLPRMKATWLSVSFKKHILRLDYPDEEIFPVPSLVFVPVHNWLVESDSTRIRPEYHYLIGRGNSFNAMLNGRGFCEDRGIGFIVVLRTHDAQVLKFLEDRSISFINLIYPYERYLRGHGLDEAGLWVGRDDHHPNAVGQRIEGEALYRNLVRLVGWEGR